MNIKCNKLQGYAEFYHLGYIAMSSVENKLTYQRHMSHPSLGSMNKPSKNPANVNQSLLPASCWFLLWLTL
jgi:hypothetical protein